MVTGILDSMRWLGLDWDEGPGVGGPHAPYFQTERLPLYRAGGAAAGGSGPRLLLLLPAGGSEGQARAAEQAGDVVDLRPDVPALPADEIRARRRRRRVRARSASSCRTAGRPFDDLVHGRIDFDNATIEDFVVLRSDGYPTYHLSVVVDDVEMAMTHVVRGDDHISNTPKQVLLYHAMQRAGAGVCARAADSRAGQEAAEQAPRRDVGRRVREAGLPAGSDGQLPRAARLVARQRRGSVHARRAGRAVHARRHQRRQRRLQSGEAGLVQPAAHPADAVPTKSSRASRPTSRPPDSRVARQRDPGTHGAGRSISSSRARRKLTDIVAAAAAVSRRRDRARSRPPSRSICPRRIWGRTSTPGAIACGASTPFAAADARSGAAGAGRRTRHQGRHADSCDARGGHRPGRQSRHLRSARSDGPRSRDLAAERRRSHCGHDSPSTRARGRHAAPQWRRSPVAR